MPETGETFRYGKLNLETVDMDGHHIDKVLVTFIEENESTPEE
ncbi:MAG: hypothetical protein ABFC12_05865 [Methanobacterium sp.]